MGEAVLRSDHERLEGVGQARPFEQRRLLAVFPARRRSLFVDQFQAPELRNGVGGSCTESDAESACNPFTDPARCRDVDDCSLDPERAQLREPGLVDGFGKGAAQTCLDLGPSPLQIVVLRQLPPALWATRFRYVGGSPTPQAARESSSGLGPENQPLNRARTGLAQFARKTNCDLVAAGRTLPDSCWIASNRSTWALAERTAVTSVDRL